MKYLILLVLLLSGCTTLGTRTMVEAGDKLCKNNHGLKDIQIQRFSFNNVNKARWVHHYNCKDGAIFVKIVY